LRRSSVTRFASAVDPLCGRDGVIDVYAELSDGRSQANAAGSPRTYGTASCCKRTAAQNARIVQALDAANGLNIGIDLGF
jgi:hypothetical protein